MDKKCLIYLTWPAESGSLSLLFPALCLENDSLPSRLASTRETLDAPSPDRAIQRRSLSTLARLARSTRSRFGVALLALGGGLIATDRADAGTIVPGVVVENVFNDQPQRALALDNFDVVGYRLGNADGAADDTAKWFAFELSDDLTAQGFDVDFYAEFTPNPPGTVVVSPDQEPGEMRSKYFMVLGDLPEFSSLAYGVVVTNGPNFLGLNEALPNSKVYAGFGQLSGTPQTLDEAINMTDLVMVGQYPASVELDDAWIFAQVDQPPALPGDFDGNGVVDGSDLTVWQDSFGLTEGDYPADADRNGDVDGADFLVWQRNLGLGAMNAVSAGTPEPSSGSLAAAAVAAAGLAHRRRLQQALGRST